MPRRLMREAFFGHCFAIRSRSFKTACSGLLNTGKPLA
jgi:hypothetical protein